MSIDAMKLALEAFKKTHYALIEAGLLDQVRLDENFTAAEALRQAIEQAQKQEPVAWMYPDDYERMTTNETFCTVYSVEVGSATRGESTVALYTSPPQRQPLTWEKVLEIGLECANDHSRLPYEVKVARAIEAAHGIKGEA